MLKIHYHSDCPFFAGCENMLANFFNSVEFRETHNISFSYRYSAKYAAGFERRVSEVHSVFPINFPNLSDISQLPNMVPLLGRRILMKVIRLLFVWPLFAYEVFILTRLFKQLAPEILHINNGGYPAALSARAAVVAGKLASVPRIVMVVNNFAESYNSLSRWFDYPVDWFVARLVDLFITGSIAAGQRIQSVLSLSPEKSLSIHNGIADKTMICSIDETRRRLGLTEYKGVIFGVVALLIPRKGHQVLLDAVLRISKHQPYIVPPFKILIEGSGPLKEQLTSFVHINSLSHFVEFVGDENNIADFMSALDVLILPSVQDEDFPNVVLEAMALGKPVIASNLAGTPEQVTSYVNGILVEPRDTQQLADAIIFLVQNELARIAMGEAAFAQHKEKFSARVAIHKYELMYNKLLNINYDKC